MRSLLAVLFVAVSANAAVTGTLLDEHGKPVAGLTVVNVLPEAASTHL